MPRGFQEEIDQGDLLDRSPWLITASGSGLSYLWPTYISPTPILDLDPKLGGSGGGAEAGCRHTDNDLLREQPGGEQGVGAGGTVSWGWAASLACGGSRLVPGRVKPLNPLVVEQTRLATGNGDGCFSLRIQSIGILYRCVQCPLCYALMNAVLGPGGDVHPHTLRLRSRRAAIAAS